MTGGSSCMKASPSRSIFWLAHHIRLVLMTAFGSPVAPEGLTEVLVQLRDRYGDRLPPVHVTESGCSTDDVVEDGTVHDEARIRYLDRHLEAVAAAIDAGVDVRGYFVWSLLDNFEWAFGYDRRFGITHVDFASQERTVKDSGRWYSELVRAHQAQRPAAAQAE